MATENYVIPHVELIEQCARGDRRAQYRVYQLYAKSMLHVCMRILQNVQEAEDVLQEAFFDAFTKMETFRFESSFGAWLKQIVVRKAINQLRQRKIDFLSIDACQDSFSEDTDDPDLPEHTTVEKITAAIAQLPEGYRTVLSLYLFEGYDHEEIGHILSVNEVTSRTQYSRAKKRLLSLLSHS
ncbi:MAG: RNA polymerase sigma factor [Spirosomataceae bacterium]